jgi:MoxR-like ATPase
MNHAEFMSFVSAAPSKMAGKGYDYSCDRESEGAYPFWDGDASECRPSIARAFVMKENGGSKIHNVVIACTQPGDFFIWCGDNFLEGGTCKPPALERIDMAAQELTSLSNAGVLMAEMGSKFQKSTGCHFWQHYKTNNALCKHCNQLLVQKTSAISDILDSLENRYKSTFLGQSPATEVSMPADAFARTVMKVPVLIEGEKGWGKTREAKMLTDTLGVKLIEIQGHEGLESSDLTGHVTRHGHDMVWKDGRLSQAFRLASKGTKVLVLIDEMLRVPQRQLSVLLSALAPHDGNYYLSTNRIIDVVDGIGSEETLVCPVDNLYVVATTNVGGQYSVEVCDPALQERFLLVRKYADVGIIKSAVLAAATAKGFSAKVADQCVAFYEAMKALKPNNLVADIPNVRTMLRAVHLSDKEADMKESVRAQVLTWVGRTVDGEPVQEQVDAVLKAVEKVWK